MRISSIYFTYLIAFVVASGPSYKSRPNGSASEIRSAPRLSLRGLYIVNVHSNCRAACTLAEIRSKNRGFRGQIAQLSSPIFPLYGARQWCGELRARYIKRNATVGRPPPPRGSVGRTPQKNLSQETAAATPHAPKTARRLRENTKVQVARANDWSRNDRAARESPKSYLVWGRKTSEPRRAAPMTFSVAVAQALPPSLSCTRTEER